MNAYKAYKKSKDLYDKVKADNPMHTEVKGNLYEIIAAATDTATADRLKGLHLTDNPDGLLDFLYGCKALNIYTYIDRAAVDAIIKAVEGAASG